MLITPKASARRRGMGATACMLFLIFLAYTYLGSSTRRHSVSQLDSSLAKLKFGQFLDLLKDAPPADATVYEEEGLAIERIEDLNEDHERRNFAAMSTEDFDFSQANHRRVVEKLPEFQSAIEYIPGSQGIVTVGGGNYTTSILVTLRFLRKNECKLPMEVFIPSDETYDEFLCETVMSELNARCIHLPTFDNVEIHSFQFKSFALIFSSFEHALFLDSDSIPIIDPTELFSSPAYKKTGYVTWPDFWASTASHIFYEIIGKPTPSLHDHASTESGEILVNRRLHARTLLLNVYYNLFGPDFYYLLLAQGSPGGDGDKETWVAAAVALDMPYYQVREMNKVITRGDYLDMGDDIAMVQYDLNADYAAEKKSHATSRNTPKARAIFVHHSRIKLTPWYLEDQVVEHVGHNRMWGPKQQTIDRFGSDLEASIWNEILIVACRYPRNDKEREKCMDLRDFWLGILGRELLNPEFDKVIARLPPMVGPK